MRVFSVYGSQGTGKTTTIEILIRELRRRGFSVGSIKEIHNDAFYIDTPGSNTDRHRQAGAQLVCARGINETDILYQNKLSLPEILCHFNHDFVVCEGVTELNIPKIITGMDAQDLESRWQENIFAISGQAANTLAKLHQTPAISAIKEPIRLADLAIQQAMVFHKPYDLEIFQVQSRFKSRRNQVFLINSYSNSKLIVMKKFASPVAMRQELMISLLLKQSGFFVPQIISSANDTIKMDYIEAPTLCDLLTQAESQKNQLPSDLLPNLVRQLKNVYMTSYFKASGFVLHDVNLRNFLVLDSKICMIDFEDAGPGSITDDLGGIIAFILTYDPAFTSWKQALAIRLAEIMLEEFAVHPETIQEAVNIWLKKLAVRRKKTEPYPIWIFKRPSN